MNKLIKLRQSKSQNRPQTRNRFFSRILLLFGIILAAGSFNNLLAQQPAPSTSVPASIDPSTVKADALNDAQVTELMQKAQASGMSDEQIRQAAIAKGMPEGEVSKLQSRINALRSSGNNNAKDPNAKTNTDTRQVNGNENNISSPKAAPASSPAVFGSELFNNANLTFEPNLRLPTPHDYILGPDDQLIVNIYGNSQADWKLSISPDGSIQLPGVGLLYVSGKTVEQATGLIKSMLAVNHYAIGHGTNVAVNLGNIRSIKVYLVGELVKPGTYTLSSLSTIFNALYLSGGPNTNGSFRQIELIRDNQKIKTLDIYDFLLKGIQKDNIRLLEGDIIRVPTYKVRVNLTGQVKRPSIYEVLPGETLHDVINFAGGFTDIAYTYAIKAIQLTSQDKRVTDIKAEDFNNYIPLRGDKYVVDRILDAFENRVTIFGAVLRPGSFELSKGLTLTQLVKKAEGLKPDAFTARGIISRLKSDNTTELIAFDYKSILNGTSPDILLKKEDQVTISSIFDLRNDYTVTINGEVRNGGDFPYADSLKVEDLVIQAGGFTEGASPKRIEVARRVNNADPTQQNSASAQVFSINLDDKFSLSKTSFLLQPFDVVSVYTLPGYEKQKTVKIEGEVLYPGFYTIKTKAERISDLVKRSGGLTAFADIDGVRLIRSDNLGVDASKGKVDLNSLMQEKASRLQHVQLALKDSTNSIFEQFHNDYVGIDLKAILKDPGSNIDLILQEGDRLLIPKKQQLVKVNGEVLFPSSVVYANYKSFLGYINSAGGFSPSALRRRAYVVYANGTVRGTKTFLFIKSYPTIKAGSEVVVPKKPESKGITATEVGSIFGTLTSAAAVLIGVISIIRK